MLQRAAPETIISDRAPGELRNILDWWNAQRLAIQFLLAGGAVSLVAMAIVGAVVTSLIEAGITRNSAAATALYVDSVIAPLLPDMQQSKALDDIAARALDETLGQGALGRRLMSFRLWRGDGTVLYSSEKDLTGRRFEPNPDLKAALEGQMVARFDEVDDVESRKEQASGRPLLEIYNPVRQPWSGEVVAVSEFYEVATEFEATLKQARVWSWAAVAAVTLAFFLLLSAIVIRGSRTIDRQSVALKERVGELSDLLTQNGALHARLQRASQRVAALNESYLRRLGADLHDGPAQLVALAALRLDSAALTDTDGDSEKRELEISSIKASLDDALGEIRSICQGLVLPQIETAELAEILSLAARAHHQRTRCPVKIHLSGSPRPLSPSEKIGVYRFVQEALNNGYRHAGGAGQRIMLSCPDDSVTIEVSDSGPGFDPEAIPAESLGLAGLRERVESLGGSFAVESSKKGTKVTMSLKANEWEQA